MQKISAKLLRVEKLTNDVCEFEFSGEASGSEASREASREGLNFKPGQFMLLNVPAGEDGTPPVSRAYSLAGVQEELQGKADDGAMRLLFCIKLIPGGRGSEYLRSLKVGDSVQLQGPSGHFVLGDEGGSDGKDIIMVATGVGISPFMAMLKNMFDGDSSASKAAKHADRKVFLHFGVRHEDDVFYKEQLEEWKAAHDNFDFTLTLSQPSENWTGAKGRVTDHLAEQFKNLDAANTEIFICGNGAMVLQVKTMAEEAGLERAAIHFELFSPIVSK